MKRLISCILMLVLLVSFLPLIAHAAAVELDNLEYAIFPMDVLHISRSNNKAIGENKWGEGSHKDFYSFDFSGADTTVVAPFTMQVVAIGGDHSVVFESVNKVHLANGTEAYLTCMYTHDNNISGIKVGQVYKQGQYFYDQGDYGNATGVHLHMEIALGKGYYSNNKLNEANLKKLRTNGIQVYDALYVKTSTKISSDNGYPWRSIQEVDFHVGSDTIKRYYPTAETFGTLPVATESGKVFQGWYTADGNKVDDTSYPNSSHRHLYPQLEDVGDLTSKVFWISLLPLQVTENDAVMSVSAKVPSCFDNKVFKFYIGTDPNLLIECPHTYTTSSIIPLLAKVFSLEKAGITLQPDTTYYYRYSLSIKDALTFSEIKSFTTPKPPAPSLNVNWSVVKASNITKTNATISGQADYEKTVSPEKCGFYLGTSKDSMVKADKFDTISGTRDYSAMSYDLNKYGQTLKAGTTYYYQFYVVVDGVEHKSDIQSFTTKAEANSALNITWSDYKVSSITQTNATIAGKATYGKTVSPEKCGFYLGTSKNSMVKADKFDTITGTRDYSGMSYDLNKYGQTLKAGTTYYYQFYVVVGGVE